jgi:hypothetical protein
LNVYIVDMGRCVGRTVMNGGSYKLGQELDWQWTKGAWNDWTTNDLKFVDEFCFTYSLKHFAMCR